MTRSWVHRDEAQRSPFGLPSLWSATGSTVMTTAAAERSCRIPYRGELGGANRRRGCHLSPVGWGMLVPRGYLSARSRGCVMGNSNGVAKIEPT
jgi:hypothetical protein